MTAIEGGFGIATIKWADWQTLLGHMRNLLSDGESYRGENGVLRAENATLKARVNDLVGVVQHQQIALDERDALLAKYKEQRQGVLADVATASAALQKASDAFLNSREMAKQNEALGNNVKAAAIIDGIRALLALAEKAGVPRSAMLFLLTFCIKFAEMPDGKTVEFINHFTGGNAKREIKPGGRMRSASETMLTARIAAFYAALKKKGVPSADAKAALAKACGLSQEQRRKILDIKTRVEGDPAFKNFYREAETAIEKMTELGLTPVKAATGFLRELFEQDPTLLKYIQKQKS